MTRLSPAERLARYGPTTGDRVRLGDTDLWVRVGDDRQAPGDEPIWGYAKTLRPLATQGRPSASELDAVIAGALVLDPVLGAVKADIGIKDGRIVGVGRAGNDAVSDGIELPIGPHTQPIMGYGLIATPGAVDSHVHLISPELLPAALSGGVTTLITAGFEEPPAAMPRLLDATVDWPLNIGLQACARSEDDGSLEALLDAGACGFKIHEDYGADPALIDHTLRFAEAHDVAVALHTDGLHESAELEDTVAAIDGRTVHAYHVEGSGGGHVPDAIGLVREPNIICSSTTPTVPWGVAAAAEQVPMIVLNHGASFGGGRRPGARPRPGPRGDDGRRGAAPRARRHRHRQLRLAGDGPDDGDGPADVPAGARDARLAGHGPGPDAYDDTARVLRYLAKVTIEPAITHGIAAHVGSLQPGRLADIVLWEPAYFGVKPALVLKGGRPAWAPLGEGNATRRGRRADPLSAGLGRAGSFGGGRLGHVRVGDAAWTRRTRTAGVRTRIAVAGTRGLTRADLVHNRAAPPIEVDVTDGTVRLDGRSSRSIPSARCR